MDQRCPVCGKGKLRTGTIREEMFGVDLGTYDGELCDACGESFLGSGAMKAIEARARALGLWGLGTKVKVVRSGNSLVVRIPAPLARHLKIRAGQEVMVSPNKENGLILELI